MLANKKYETDICNEIINTIKSMYRDDSSDAEINFSDSNQAS